MKHVQVSLYMMANYFYKVFFGKSHMFKLKRMHEVKKWNTKISAYMEIWFVFRNSYMDKKQNCKSDFSRNEASIFGNSFERGKEFISWFYCQVLVHIKLLLGKNLFAASHMNKSKEQINFSFSGKHQVYFYDLFPKFSQIFMAKKSS